jgi:tetratricopeptide (TPR) repeat protein
MRRHVAVLALVVVSCGASAACLLGASRLSDPEQTRAPVLVSGLVRIVARAGNLLGTPLTSGVGGAVRPSSDRPRVADGVLHIQNPPVALGAGPQATRQPPTYLLLIDTESFDGDEARKACAVAGAFVDGLDPEDRVVILSAESGVGRVEASQDRLTAGASLASIVETAAETAAARRGESGLTLSEALRIASGDDALLTKLTAERLGKLQREQNPYSDSLMRRVLVATATQAVNRAGSGPLAPVTTQLLPQQSNSRPVTVVWFSNRPRPLPPSGSEADRGLIDALVAAHARISIVATAYAEAAPSLNLSTQLALREDHAGITKGTGGVLLRGVSNVDAAAAQLLKATEGLGRRRPDPAGRSELTSLRRAAERPLNSAYATLVRQYLTGDADAAVRTLLSWLPDQIAASVHPLSSRAELDAAIALHTEAACRDLSPAVFEQHFWITQRAMAAMVDRMRDVPLRRYWIRAMATGSAAHARRIAPGDPEITSLVLVAVGALMEAPTDALREAQTDFDHPRVPEADLARAAATYREALALNDGLWEARLRLGSVFGRLHQTDEAMAQLERVRTQATDPRFRYLAWLALGQIHEQAGERETAGAAYEEAIRTFPDGFIARAALAQLLQSSGRLAEGRKVMQEALLRQPRGRAESDPWHEYLYSSLSQMERHLAALRAAARRESEVAK